MTDESRDQARSRVRSARAAGVAARTQLERAIRDAHAAGVPQTQIAEDSGFTRVWIRHLLDQQEEPT